MLYVKLLILKYLQELTVENAPQTILNNLQGLQDPWDILFARAEGLHAHGHTREACILGVKLAEEMLANPPDLMIDLPPIQTKGKRKKVIHYIYCCLFTLMYGYN